MKQLISSHLESFSAKLLAADALQVSDNAYCQRYFRHLQIHHHYFLNIYADVLERVLLLSQMKPDQIVLVDFGCGNGLLALLARYCGFGKVIACDRDVNFIQAAQTLSTLMNIPLDHVLCGDEQTLKRHHLTTNINVIVGTDVIEHIYNLDLFFKTIASMNIGMVSVFTTASNPQNPFIVRRLKRLQLRDEYKGATPEDAVLTGNTAHEAFFVIRKKIIQNAFPNEGHEFWDDIAHKTRGMNRSDILNWIAIYNVNKKMPHMLSHPTNTCNPISGSWTERLLSLDEYKTIYGQHGFSLQCNNGYYDTAKPFPKNIVARCLNVMVKWGSMKLAPFIILSGKNVNK